MTVAKGAKYVVVSVLIVGLLAGVYVWKHSGNKEIIARVGDIEIDRVEFLNEMKLRGGRFVQELDKQALLDEMVERKLLLSKAAELEYSEDLQVKRQYENILIARVRRELLDKRLAALSINDAEVRQHYDSNLKAFGTPGKDRLAILFVAKNRTNKKSALDKLREISALADEGGLTMKPSMGFGAYSVAHSDHQVSRYKGGEIGWFKQNEATYWEAPVLQAGFALSQPGDISEVVKTEKGHYLVRLMDRKAPSNLSFERVKPQIESELIRAKQVALKAGFYKDLRASLGVYVDKDRLESVRLEKQYAGGIEEQRPPDAQLN